VVEEGVRIARVDMYHLAQEGGDEAPADGSESWGVSNVCLLRLETDDGIVGWADIETQPTVARAALDAPDQWSFRGIRHTILGQDPLEVDRLWREMYKDSIYYGRRGVAIQVMSGVVNACYDIMGKAFGVPLCKLLGGQYRDRVKAYASTLFRPTPELMATAVREYLDRGFRAIKFGYGVFRDDAGRDVELVAAAREAAGPDVELMLDPAWFKPGITLRNTIELCERLHPYGITWFEDCLHPENYEGYRILCGESPIPIAAGEQEATIWGFRQLLTADLGYVQPDLSRCGGLSVAKQIAAIAEERQIQVVPHAWLTDLLTATSLHLNAWLEHAAYLEFNVSAGPLARDLFREPITLQPDGTLLVPTGPGIGVEPDPDAIERYRVRP
jgi:L-alanine-DL-glutamate epimerase-like enolase superfamily enzyme